MVRFESSIMLDLPVELNPEIMLNLPRNFGPGHFNVLETREVLLVNSPTDFHTLSTMRLHVE